MKVAEWAIVAMILCGVRRRLGGGNALTVAVLRYGDYADAVGRTDFQIPGALSMRHGPGDRWRERRKTHEGKGDQADDSKVLEIPHEKESKLIYSFTLS